MNSNFNTAFADDEISIKEIFYRITEFYKRIKGKIIYILFISLIGGALGFSKAYFSTPIYSAKIKFLLKESGGAASTLASSLGSLGSIFGGSAGLATPSDRILAVLGSERIVGNALLKQMIVGNKSDLAINHFIKIQNLQKKWSKDSLLRNCHFSPFTKKTSFDFSQRKAYKNIINIFLADDSNILRKTCDKKSGVFEISINSNNEIFSIEFSKLLYKELEDFLYNQSISASGKNVIILNKKIDSVKYELGKVQGQLARNADRSLGILMQEDIVDQKKLLIKEQILTVMYGEAQRNLETFKFLNESINNGLEIIDFPFAPIKPEENNLVKYTITGFFIFGFISLFFFYARIWYDEHI